MKMNNWLALFAIVPIVGCAQTYNPFNGLCSTDKTETYSCLEEGPLYLAPLNYDRGRNCLNISQNDEEWSWCMDPDNDHIYDPYYQQREDFRIHRKEFFKELFKEKLRKRILKLKTIA